MHPPRHTEPAATVDRPRRHLLGRLGALVRSTALLATLALPAWPGQWACAADALPAGAGAAPAARRLAPDIAKLVARGELVVAMLATDTPPFFFGQGDQLQGLDVDMARDLARELGVGVRFDRSATSFNEVVDKVSRGEADVGISKISRTLARAKAVRFSNAYLSLHHALILNRLAFARLAGDRPPQQVMKDYDGSLGVIAKSSFQDFAQTNFPHARIRPYGSWSDVVAAVERGEVIAGYRDEFEVKRLLAERPSVALRLRTITLKDREDTLGIAIGADAPMLHAFINQFLASRRTRLDIQQVLQALPGAPSASRPAASAASVNSTAARP